MKLDLKDRKLLAYLDENSRVPESELAKKLRLSRQATRYRLNRLKEKGVIKKFVTVIDPTKFTENIWHVYLKLQNITKENENKILNYMNSNNNVWWIALCEGEWDIIFSYAGKDIYGFDEFMQKFNTEFSKEIYGVIITTFVKSELLPRGYFLSKKRETKTYVARRKKEDLAEKEVLVLKLLAENSRMRATEIARQANISLRQATYSISRLVEKEVIRGFKIQVDTEKIGYDFYKVCFYTQDFTETTEKKILYWCTINPYPLFYVRKIAPWTFEIEFEAPSYKALNESLRDLRGLLGGSIKRTETTLITKEYKGELNILKTIEN